MKSFVWYSPQAFKDKGYEVPKTWAELLALSDKIVADNPGGDVKPWCAGIESGDATGWPATDWVEDVMLRTAGPEIYDKWVKHEIPFNDPAVATALAEVGKILKNPKYVNGGFGDVKTIASTSFQDAGLPILDGHLLHAPSGVVLRGQLARGHQGRPRRRRVGLLPAVRRRVTKPVLDCRRVRPPPSPTVPRSRPSRPTSSSTEWANERAKTCGSGGCVTANKNADPNLLTNPVDKLSAEILTDKSATSRFDGSDLMPGAVGAGTFWKGMTNWITGQDDKATLDYIENSWPKS